MALLSARDLEKQVSGCTAHFGEQAGQKLAELLCEIGLCFRCGAGGGAAGAGAVVGSAPESAQDACPGNDVYFFPALLEEASRPDDLLLTRASAPFRLGRRFLARSADEMLVPGFMARLQVRAAESDSFAATSDYQKRLWRDGMLLQQGGAQVLWPQPCD